jgi:hypothetical protein
MINGNRYHKYCKAIEKIISELKKDIDTNSDMRLHIKLKDFAKKMGPEFEKLQSKSLYWAVKPCLFDEDIVIATGRIDREDSIILRRRNSQDTLPRSLAENKIKRI